MKIIRLIIIFVGILVGILIVADLVRNRKADHSIPWAPEDLAAATEVLNSKCPEMVDPESRLDSVLFSDEGQLIYYYTLIERDRHTIDSVAFVAYLKPEVIKEVRFNSYLKMHRDSSVTMLFKYRDRTGEPLAVLTLRPQDYR